MGEFPLMSYLQEPTDSIRSKAGSKDNPGTGIFEKFFSYLKNYKTILNQMTLLGLKIRIKFIIFFFLLTIPLGVLLSLTIVVQNRAIAATKKEILGIAYVKELFYVFSPIYLLEQQELFESLNSTPKKEPIRGRLASIKENFQSLESVQSSYGHELNTTEHYNQLQSLLNDIYANYENKSVDARIDILKQTTQKIFLINIHIGDNSSLLLDQELDSYYTMDLFLLKLPLVLESMEEIDRSSIDFISNKPATPEKSLLNTSLIQYETYLKQYETTSNALFKYTPEAKLDFHKDVSNSVQTLNRYRNFLRNEVLERKNPEPIKYADIREETKAAHLTLLNSYQSILLFETSLLQKRKLRLQSEQLTSISIFSILIIFIVYVQYKMNKSVKLPLNTAMNLMKELTKGNLKVRFDEKFKYEFGDFAEVFNSFIEDLTKIISAFKSTSEKASKSSEDLKGLSEKMNIFTKEQISNTKISTESVEQISDSFNEMLSWIEMENKDILDIVTITKQITTSSSKITNIVTQISEIAHSSVEETKQGDIAVTDANASMNDIKKIAEEISKMTVIINEISNQTNLISLNASIEATKAGESSQRFGMVANEISKLSGRTVQSISHIKNLIQSTDSSIKQGLESVNGIVSILQKVVEKIGNLNSNIEFIKKEVANQDNTTMEINNSYKDLQLMSKQIKENYEVEQAAVASLKTAINNINLKTNDITDYSSKLADMANSMQQVSSDLQAKLEKFTN